MNSGLNLIADIFSPLWILIISYLTALYEPDAILSTDMKSLRDKDVPVKQ
jgi:hypothetical protein